MDWLDAVPAPGRPTVAGGDEADVELAGRRGAVPLVVPSISTRTGAAQVVSLVDLEITMSLAVQLERNRRRSTGTR
jgi:hypothetical protein